MTACRSRESSHNDVACRSFWTVFKDKEALMIANEFTGLIGRYGSILIDPPWRFANRTGKMAPEHKRLRRYPTMSFDEIAALPVEAIAAEKSHLYLWCPNA